MTRKNTYSELLDNGYVVGSLSCDTVALISGCDLGSYFSGKEMCLFGDISTNKIGVCIFTLIAYSVLVVLLKKVKH